MGIAESMFADRLSELMKERRVTQEMLADVLGITRQTVALYSKGTTKPDSDGISAIARHFGVTSDWLLGLSDVRSYNQTAQAAHNYTGLSEKALKYLRELNKQDDDTELRFVNILFGSDKIPFIEDSPVEKMCHAVLRMIEKDDFATDCAFLWSVQHDIACTVREFVSSERIRSEIPF